MTIEQLLGKSADELEVMSDAEKLQYFSKYLPLTRPEMVVKEVEHKGPRIVTADKLKRVSKTAQAQAILDQLKAQGVLKIDVKL